jgi:hypothetical protein
VKLSEAIRMNGMMKPQGFGGDSIASFKAPCALGGALQSVGRQLINRAYGLSAVAEEWPWTSVYTNERFSCPACGLSAFSYGTLARNIIWHLNDQHHWTRQQIADWVQSVEPAEVIEPDQEQTCEGVGTRASLTNATTL